MPALARGQASNCAFPALDIFTSIQGILIDVYSLEFQIFDESDSAKQLNPVQVYPATVGLRQTVNVSTLCPTAGAGKISTGRYVAEWTPPVSPAEPLGTHRIKWFFKLTSISPEQTFNEEFEVLAEVSGSGQDGYCFVSDLRDEGVPSTGAGAVSDAFLLKRIALASRFIEKATGRFFAPRALTFHFDGTGGAALLLRDPIISIAGISLVSGAIADQGTEISLASLRVYNRHLSEGLLNPDDRDNPRLELGVGGWGFGYDDVWFSSFPAYGFFPRGRQNVVVSGIFGYTDPDGSSTGGTPELIRHACKLMVMRELAQLADRSGRADAQNAWRLTSERTRDQAYTLADPASLKRTGALFTGDPDIDTLLSAFIRPPDMGAT